MPEGSNEDVTFWNCSSTEAHDKIGARPSTHHTSDRARGASVPDAVLAESFCQNAHFQPRLPEAFNHGRIVHFLMPSACWIAPPAGALTQVSTHGLGCHL